MDDLQKQIQKIKALEKNFKINELKDFNISEYLDNKEIKDEYLAQVLKDGDKDELLEALKNIEKAKKLNF
jgi:DNA-binding phage protein